jgi:hypothetical protein
MKPTPFIPETDMAPIPFNKDLLDLAREMKQNGLQWKPHVGCFVWDPEMHIHTESPFPLRVYFILSLPRFISIFGTIEAIAEKLIWLPTWHQARFIAENSGIEHHKIAGLLNPESLTAPGDELSGIYRLILEKLQTG